MALYKIVYVYTDYSDSIHGLRVQSYDEFEAESAQDAVDQCRQEFYIKNRLEILSVSKMTRFGYYLPILESAWM